MEAHSLCGRFHWFPIAPCLPRPRRMGFKFQFYNLQPVLSAVENVELPLMVSSVGLREARKRALESMDQVRLAHRVNHGIVELSEVEQQQTTIAHAPDNRPGLVWADESTVDLDTETANEIIDFLVDLNRKRELTIILVKHSRELGPRCEGIVRMRDGLIENQQPNMA